MTNLLGSFVAKCSDLISLCDCFYVKFFFLEKFRLFCYVWTQRLKNDWDEIHLPVRHMQKWWKFLLRFKPFSIQYQVLSYAVQRQFLCAFRSKSPGGRPTWLNVLHIALHTDKIRIQWSRWMSIGRRNWTFSCRAFAFGGRSKIVWWILYDR